jgi:hypothetical protein
MVWIKCYPELTPLRPFRLTHQIWDNLVPEALSTPSQISLQTGLPRANTLKHSQRMIKTLPTVPAATLCAVGQREKPNE